MSFSIIKHIDQALVSDEERVGRASRTPAVWPSEASAYRLNSRTFKKYGACMRKVIYRLIDWPKVGEQDPAGLWKFVLGRAIEEKLTELTRIAVVKQLKGEDGEPQEIREDVYVANGVKLWVPSIYLALELDIVTIDPETKRGYILECKSYDGYFKEKKIEKEGRPDESNLLQLCLYLYECKTGKRLKELVHQSLEERRKLDAKHAINPKFTHRNRCEADIENLEQMDDGPIGAKLVYVSRGTCYRREFDVSIMQDADGYHYPVVDGVPYKIFTIESIYEIFREAQDYWFRMRQEAVRLLALDGVHPPQHLKLILSREDEPGDRYGEITKDEVEEQKKYLALLEEEVRNLPDSFFPPPEYEFIYPADRIIQLGEAGEIGKTKFGQWQKGKLKEGEILGDWQCRFCDYAMSGCVQKQHPELAHLVYDLSNIPEDAEVTFG